MKSSLTNYRQPPRKVRLVANLIKGKTVKNALAELELLPKRASLPIKKLILSAVANTKNNSKADENNLIVKDLRVDKGVVMKRMMPRARGTGFQILKRTSHILVVLGEGKPKIENLKIEKKKNKSTKKPEK